MNIKFLQPENKQMQTESTVEEKEEVVTVLTTLLACIGSAIIFSISFFEKESILGFILPAVGFGIVMVSCGSYVHLILEEDLFKKLFGCFPDRIQKILFSPFPYGPLAFSPGLGYAYVLVWNEGMSLIPNVLALIFCLFLAVYAIVNGYRNTREPTKDVQLN
ncbi:unnamed protein product [Caenorhabditis brenneri]